jgi:putative NADH-flavin reductase
MSTAALSSAPLAARARVACAKSLRTRKVAATTRIAAATRAAATPAEKGNIVVIGGTGGTGAECVVQALKRGCKVTVLARTPSKMVQPPGSGGANEGKPLSDPNLTVVQGDVTNAADVMKVITADVTGVVVSLGGKTKDVGKTMLTDGTLNVINAMKKSKVDRVAVVTSIGAGDSADQAPLVFRILMSTVMRSIFTDKNNQEQLFLGPGGPGRDLEFCIVRPGGLGTGPPTGVINVIDGEAGSIARADVADFCLGALFETDFPYLKKAPCISSVGGTSWVKDRGNKGMMES